MILTDLFPMFTTFSILLFLAPMCISPSKQANCTYSKTIHSTCFPRHTIRAHLISLYEASHKFYSSSSTNKKSPSRYYHFPPITKECFPNLWSVIDMAINRESDFHAKLDSAYEKFKEQSLYQSYLVYLSNATDLFKVLEISSSSALLPSKVAKFFFCYDILFEEKDRNKARCLYLSYNQHKVIKSRRRKKMAANKQGGRGEKKDCIVSRSNESLETKSCTTSKTIAECLAHNLDVLHSCIGYMATKEYAQVIYPGSNLRSFYYVKKVGPDAQFVRCLDPRFYPGQLIRTGDIIFETIDVCRCEVDIEIEGKDSGTISTDKKEGNCSSSIDKQMHEVTGYYSINKIHLHEACSPLSLLVTVATNGSLVEHLGMLYMYLTLPTKCPCGKHSTIKGYFAEGDNSKNYDIDYSKKYITGKWLYSLFLRNHFDLSNFWDPPRKESHDIDPNHPHYYETFAYTDLAVRTNYILNLYFYTGNIEVLHTFYPGGFLQEVILPFNHKLTAVSWPALYRAHFPKSEFFQMAECDATGKLIKWTSYKSSSIGMFIPLNSRHLVRLIENEFVAKKDIRLGYFLQFIPPTIMYLLNPYQEPSWLYSEGTMRIYRFGLRASIMASPLALHLLFRSTYQIGIPKDNIRLQLNAINQSSNNRKDSLCRVRPFFLNIEQIKIDSFESAEALRHYYLSVYSQFLFNSDSVIPLVIPGQQVFSGQPILLQHTAEVLLNMDPDEQINAIQCDVEHGLIMLDLYGDGFSLYMANVDVETQKSINLQEESQLINDIYFCQQS